jgi:hypothetical protein
MAGVDFRLQRPQADLVVAQILLSFPQSLLVFQQMTPFLRHGRGPSFGGRPSKFEGWLRRRERFSVVAHRT